MNLALVALGGAAGAVCRALAARLTPVGATFPTVTLCVNVLGCLLIGLLTAWLGRLTAHAAALRALLVVGFCGGFTTFSTFSAETVRLLAEHRVGAALAYVLASVFAGLAAVALASR